MKMEDTATYLLPCKSDRARRYNEKRPLVAVESGDTQGLKGLTKAHVISDENATLARYGETAMSLLVYSYIFNNIILLDNLVRKV